MQIASQLQHASWKYRGRVVCSYEAAGFSLCKLPPVSDMMILFYALSTQIWVFSKSFLKDFSKLQF